MSILPRPDCKPKLTLEISKSGRSACKFCLINIPQRVIRVGCTVLHKEKMSRSYTSWFHLTCVRFDKVPHQLESNEQRYCEYCTLPVGVESLSCSLVERPGQYDIRHRIHPRCLTQQLGSSCLDVEHQKMIGYQELDTQGKVFIDSLFEHAGDVEQVPYSDVHENSDNPGGASMVSSSSSSSSSSSEEIIPAEIARLHAQLSRATSKTEKNMLIQLITLEMNKSLAGETTQASFQAPEAPPGMRYCQKKRKFVEIEIGSSGIKNYGKSTKRKKTNDDDGEKKEEEEEEEKEEAKLMITCDVCGVDCTTSSWLFVRGKIQSDLCSTCVNKKSDMKQNSKLQANGVDVQVKVKNEGALASSS